MCQAFGSTGFLPTLLDLHVSDKPAVNAIDMSNQPIHKDASRQIPNDLMHRDGDTPVVFRLKRCPIREIC